MRSTYIKTGLFVIMFLVALGFLFSNINLIPVPWQATGTEMTVTLEDVAGLEEGAAVRIAGVRKGRISKIELEGEQAIVTMELDPDVEVFQGAEAQIGSMGLMGEKFLDLGMGDQTLQPLPAQSNIDGVSPTTIDELVNTFNAIGKDVKEVTESLANTVGSDDGEKSIDEIVKNIEAITGELKLILQDNRPGVGSSVDNVEAITADIREIVALNKAVVNQTLENVRAVTAELRTDIPAITDRLDGILARMDTILEANQADVRASVENITSATGKIDETMDSVQNIARKIDEGEGTIGKLINDEETVDNLNGTLVELRETVASAGEALGFVSRIKTDIGYRGELQLDSSELKSYVTLRILPRQDKYFQIDLVGDPRPTREFEVITTEVDSTVTGQETIIERRTKEQDEFRFSAQIAKKFKNLTLRGGLIESSAGFGAEYNVFDGRLQFEAEAFDFGDEFDDPHVRLSSQFYVTPNIYVKGGIDNPLNEDFDTIFLGAGFRYTDEDLKYLFGSLGGLAGGL